MEDLEEYWAVLLPDRFPRKPEPYFLHGFHPLVKRGELLWVHLKGEGIMPDPVQVAANSSGKSTLQFNIQHDADINQADLFNQKGDLLKTWYFSKVVLVPGDTLNFIIPWSQAHPDVQSPLEQSLA